MVCPITRSSAKRQPHTSRDVPDWYYLQPPTPPDVEDVPITSTAALIKPDAVQAPRLVMVGLSGASGVGKTTLAKGLAKRFASPIAPICMDNFRKKQRFMPKTQDGRPNWESPGSIDFEKLCAYLDNVKVEILAQPTEHLPDTIIIVVEGFLLFHNKAMCERLHVHLWVEADCDTCLRRRLRRNSRKDPDCASKYCNTVWPQYQLYRQEQLNNVPAAVHLNGTTLAPQLLNLAVAACTEYCARPTQRVTT